MATFAFVVLLWGLRRTRMAVSGRLSGAATRRLNASAVGDGEFVRSSRILEFLNWIVAGATWAVGVLVAYVWLMFSLRRFDATLPWGDSLRAFLLDRLEQMGGAMWHALPGLFSILVIVVLTRFATRVVQLLFQAIEDGRVAIAWIYPETADSTRQLVTVALWLFAVAVAYPYLPGSDSNAFKGVSVFVGLVISLGSSGLANQLMSGLTLTYSRAFRAGDYVAIGETEGTVTELGTLSTRIRTFRGEHVTIPNAVTVSQTVINYSRLTAGDSAFVPTEVTIGYDAPWRQVHALLLLAASRTAGIRREPPAWVRQASLEDPYVRYALLFCPERPVDRLAVLAAVHANIQDAFNEYGVQIMSPRYIADPAAPKVVPKREWFAAPSPPPAVARHGAPE